MRAPESVKIRKTMEDDGEMSGNVEVQFQECTVHDMVYLGCISSSYKDTSTSCGTGNIYKKYLGYIYGI